MSSHAPEILPSIPIIWAYLYIFQKPLFKSGTFSFEIIKAFILLKYKTANIQKQNAKQKKHHSNK